MKPTELPGGVWTALLTPFTEDGRIHEAELTRFVEVVADHGMDGIYLLGATGQGLALSLVERKHVAETALRAANGRIPVVVHVGCIGTADAVELARHAGGLGAAGISAVPPVYFPGPVDAEFTHYARIGEAGGVPFLPYINTFLTGALALPPGTYIERLLTIPNIVGAKVTTADFNAFGLLTHHAAGRLRFYSGMDECLLQAALSSATGAIGSSYNLLGPECRRAWMALRDGRVPECQRFMQAYQGVMEQALSGGGYYHFLRAGIRQRFGIDIGPGRTPACTAGRRWSDDDVRALIDIVDAHAP